MAIGVTTDLKTLLQAHTFATNANLDGEPSIHIISEDLSSFPTYGEIVLFNEQRILRREIYNRVTQTWLVQLEVKFNTATVNTSTKLDAIGDEIDSIFHTNNQDITRDYFLTFNYTKQFNRSSAYLTGVITVLEEWDVV